MLCCLQLMNSRGKVRPPVIKRLLSEGVRLPVEKGVLEFALETVWGSSYSFTQSTLDGRHMSAPMLLTNPYSPWSKTDDVFD